VRCGDEIALARRDQKPSTRTGTAPATASPVITPATTTSSIQIQGNTHGSNSLLVVNASQDVQEFTIQFQDVGLQGVDLHSTATEFHSLRLYAFDQLGLHGGDGFDRAQVFQVNGRDH